MGSDLMQALRTKEEGNAGKGNAGKGNAGKGNAGKGARVNLLKTQNPGSKHLEYRSSYLESNIYRCFFRLVRR